MGKNMHSSNQNHNPFGTKFSENISLFFLNGIKLSQCFLHLHKWKSVPVSENILKQGFAFLVATGCPGRSQSLPPEDWKPTCVTCPRWLCLGRWLGEKLSRGPLNPNNSVILWYSHWPSSYHSSREEPKLYVFQESCLILSERWPFIMFSFLLILF